MRKNDFARDITRSVFGKYGSLQSNLARFSNMKKHAKPSGKVQAQPLENHQYYVVVPKDTQEQSSVLQFMRDRGFVFKGQSSDAMTKRSGHYPNIVWVFQHRDLLSAHKMKEVQVALRETVPNVKVF